jgi:hypothetical protein
LEYLRDKKKVIMKGILIAELQASTMALQLANMMGSQLAASSMELTRDGMLASS